MMDFRFLNNKVGRWVILAPKRANRPDEGNGVEPLCPFCSGRLNHELVVYQVLNQVDSTWSVCVVKNKYPFSSVHEVIIHSPDHRKNFDALSQKQNEAILHTYLHRYNEHSHQGQVVIFHNHGVMAGESLPHPHSQVVVLPERINLLSHALEHAYKAHPKEKLYETSDFLIFCPRASQWPDEVWLVPKKRKRVFGQMTDSEVTDLAINLKRLVQLFKLRYKGDFPFNLQISSGEDFYIRMIPRLKRLGGFELATEVYVNTQDPDDTFKFIKAHFQNTQIKELVEEYTARYHKSP